MLHVKLVDGKSEDNSANMLDRWGPQLGELVWHSLTVDPSIDDVSNAHFSSVKNAIKSHLKNVDTGNLRYLEAGAYAHYTGQMLSQSLGLKATLSDISPKTLRFGSKLARKRGITNPVMLVANDYHDMPFNDSSFDVVYIASAIHHTHRPEMVLGECLRVLSPGGLFIMENEPCSRVFSFHKFLSNREDSFSPMEKALAEAGLLRTVTSAFYGSRPEALFGMIENDKIPLSLYLDKVTEVAEVVESRINYAECMGPLDHEILSMSSLEKEELASFIKKRLATEIKKIEPLLGEKEFLLGFSLPTAEEIEQMSMSVANGVKDISRLYNTQERTLALARLFGASIRLVARKEGTTKSNYNNLFSRSMAQEDGVWCEELSDKEIQIRITEPMLPDVQCSSESDLFMHFLPDEWEYFQEEHGKSMLNVNSISRVRLPTGFQSAVLLVRFYVVVDAPYKIILLCGEHIVEEIIACQNESRLIRALIINAGEYLSFKLVDLNGEVVNMPHHIRVSVLQMLPIAQKSQVD